MQKRRLHCGVLLVLLSLQYATSQTTKPVEQVLEGGKVLVELIKVLSTDKVKNEATGCKGRHADFCVVNAQDTSLTMVITSRETEEQCELIITKESRECCLQLTVGVWTYDLRASSSKESIRKGDLLIEGCNNVTMTIK